VLGSGVNVYPDEVEFVLSKSPFIKELCVFGGMVRSGARSGTEEVRAAVVPDMDRFAEAALKENMALTDDYIFSKIGEELDRLGAELTEYKRVVKYFVSKDELLKTATRKIKRFLVRKMYM
jgi:long-chain acyl-CoA synthetase